MSVKPAQLSLDGVNSTTEGATIVNTEGPHIAAGYFITGVCINGVSMQLQIRGYDNAPWENLGAPISAVTNAYVPHNVPVPCTAARWVQTGTLTGTDPKIYGYILFMK